MAAPRRWPGLPQRLVALHRCRCAAPLGRAGLPLPRDGRRAPPSHHPGRARARAAADEPRARGRRPLRARLALLAAVANLPVEAADHLAAYESEREPGPCDDGEACLARAARLLIDAGAGVPADPEDVRAVAGRGGTLIDYASARPLCVAAIGRALLVERGPEAAGSWLHDELGTSRWAGLPDCQWWPVHLTLALLDARPGRAESAEGWLRLGSVPDDVAQGARTGAVLATGEAALAAAGTTSRGRLQAEGILLGADPAQTDAVRAPAGEWSRSHDQLALLPGASTSTRGRRPSGRLTSAVSSAGAERLAAGPSGRLSVRAGAGSGAAAAGTRRRPRRRAPPAKPRRPRGRAPGARRARPPGRRAAAPRRRRG